ncbi:MAG: DUF1674 domain-containing protein [Rhodospirillales bacterium]|nr:DUF1674 domain-containing protein [Rhodospirillales bacterium]
MAGKPDGKDTVSKTPEDGRQAEKGKAKRPKEIGGRKDGLDPTRYGDWEKNGRAIDF